MRFYPLSFFLSNQKSLTLTSKEKKEFSHADEDENYLDENIVMLYVQLIVNFWSYISSPSVWK